MPNQVFISYSSIKDLDGTVTEFHKYLENEIQQNTDPSVTVFLDKEEIRTGDRWKASLTAALDQCRVFVILLSPSWLHSEWCKKEYLYFKSLQAFNPHKEIVPLRWVNTTIADAQNNLEEQEIIKQLNEIQQANWLELRYDRDYERSKPLRTAVGELGTSIANFIKGFTLIIKYPYGFEEKAKKDETNPAILGKRIHQATILTNFIPIWLAAENEFDSIGANPSDGGFGIIINKLPTFIDQSIHDHFSAEFFRTNYDALPEVEAMLADFRSKIQVFNKELTHILLSGEDLKLHWGASLKDNLLQLRTDALKIKEAAQMILNNSIAALK